MKKLIFVIACLAMSACSNSKDNPSSSPVPGPTETQEKIEVENTEATTATLVENDFCTVSRKGETRQTLNFDYGDASSTDGDWAQWVKTGWVDAEEEIVGSWSVDNESVTITDTETGTKTKYSLTFTEELGVTTGMIMTPDDDSNTAEVYSVCDAEEKVAKKRELTKKQLERIQEFHEKHGM